jgi:hypothetical protein
MKTNSFKALKGELTLMEDGSETLFRSGEYI